MAAIQRTVRKQPEEYRPSGVSAPAGRLNARRAITVAKITPATNARATIKRPRRGMADCRLGCGSQGSSAQARNVRPADRRFRGEHRQCRRAGARDLSRGTAAAVVRSSGGVSRAKRVQSGSPRMTAPSVSATATPGNARFAVSISYNRQPNAQMSLLPSTRSPMACSGLT